VSPPPPEKTAAAPPKDVPVPRIRPPLPPKPKAAPKTDDTADLNQITALLDKKKLEEMASAEPSDQPATVGSPTAASNSNAKMTANELDALRSKLAQCWSPPLGWTDPAQVRVVLMLDLNPDGTVNGVPAVLESPEGQYSSTAPESALRAVRRCAPYDLPADKYDAWKQVKVTFDPKDMGAG
jgi:colicin import membrane protein